MKVNKATLRIIVQAMQPGFSFESLPDGTYRVTWCGTYVGEIRRVGRFQQFVPGKICQEASQVPSPTHN